MKYYLQNKREPAEAIHCNSAKEALAIARDRNRKDKSANWKAYTESGELIVAFSQHGTDEIRYC